MYTRNLHPRFTRAMDKPRARVQTFVREHDRTRVQSFSKICNTSNRSRDWAGDYYYSVVMGDSSYIMIMLSIFVVFYVEQKHRLAWEKKSGPKILFYTKDLFSNEELWIEVLSI